jgi:hypothetical protein
MVVRNARHALALLAVLTISVWLLIEVKPPVTSGARASPAVAVTGLTVAWRGLDDRCGALAREPLPPYPWPIAPFNREHPVRGYFGDPRTVFSGRDENALSFHNGIDISAWLGNKVYPVVSGRVIDIDGDRVVVRATARRRFQYIHLRPEVRVGELVSASRTVLGTITRPWGHVHLTEIRSGCVVNPLARGHLTPFRDTSQPQVRAIRFEDASGNPLPASALVGNVRVIANAQDEPALPAPGQWRRMPVAPALLTWRLTTLLGRILRGGIGADFRYSEPPSSDFCAVYAPGTVQNFAAVAGVYRWAQPGRFLFDLTPRLLDTSRLHPGRYLMTVTASNLGGHTTSRTTQVNVVKRRLLATAFVNRDTRCENDSPQLGRQTGPESAIIAGKIPGQEVTFEPNSPISTDAVCGP